MCHRTLHLITGAQIYNYDEFVFFKKPIRFMRSSSTLPSKNTASRRLLKTTQYKPSENMMDCYVIVDCLRLQLFYDALADGKNTFEVARIQLTVPPIFNLM